MTAGCQSSQTSCKEACRQVHAYAQSGNFNEAPRLTPCDQLCAHPVAQSFEGCCGEHPNVSSWLWCAERATNSVRLTEDSYRLWEWILTAIQYDPDTDLVRITGVRALSSGAMACASEPVSEIAFEFTAASGEATDHEPTSTTPISLAEYEAAKWEALIFPHGLLDVPGLGYPRGALQRFQERHEDFDIWAPFFFSLQRIDGALVTWALRIPLCEPP